MGLEAELGWTWPNLDQWWNIGKEAVRMSAFPYLPPQTARPAIPLVVDAVKHSAMPWVPPSPSHARDLADRFRRDMDRTRDYYNRKAPRLPKIPKIPDLIPDWVLPVAIVGTAGYFAMRDK